MPTTSPSSALLACYYRQYTRRLLCDRLLYSQWQNSDAFRVFWGLWPWPLTSLPRRCV